MIYINLLLIFIYITVYLLTVKKKPKWYQNIDKNEHKLYFLYPITDFILSRPGINRLIYKNSRVKDAIRALNISVKMKSEQTLYWNQKLAQVIFVVFLFNLISLMGGLMNAGGVGQLEGNRFVKRPDYWEGSREVNLEVKLKPSETFKSEDTKGLEFTKDITLSLEERKHTEAEIHKVFDQSFQYLRGAVLGENSSIEYVTTHLNFIDIIPGTQILVEWFPEDIKLIHKDGSIQNKEIEREIYTSILVKLSYEEAIKEYQIDVVVIPKTFTRKEKLINRLEDKLKETSEETSTKEKIPLPETLDGFTLSWKERRRSYGMTLFITGFIAAVFTWFLSDKELEDRMKKRKEQMLIDYPEIINKFTLLMNAGMTVKQAWTKITEDYDKKTCNKKRNVRYAYEEMIQTVHELNLGVPESTAYESFGRRTGVLSYQKFSSLVSQNLKKGNKGLNVLLQKEALEAFEERKEIAKRLGEKAGTKLLLPMMLMLLIVLIIIMIPAFVSFG
ncbi:hypothetical protein I5677_08940 [Mobilitalea sibirica]|uniref:Type II secretion system protein GspF domain-containing protein n=1 Tax=Mobilitalea sibirica TaxID=1462919 RepID=A0A8J7H9D5_9FIRM|nr:hypothetical protein [Mobilitalea sibirica]MBH1941015.1 hypothetical protein [Mobilitalea sibirica]